MGRRWNKKKKDKQQNKKPAPTRSNDEDGDNYVSTIVERGNFKMEAYYAAQGLHDSYWNDQGELVPCTTVQEFNAERLKWRSSIGDILPASFRIGRDVPERLRRQLEQELHELLETCRRQAEGEVVKTLGFLPNAYQLGLDRTKIRKHPNYQQLHEWLKRQTEMGMISRQETVSMIPPVVLNPTSTDSILDMCAAPGSKTSQLLEACGRIVANDANSQRAHMLVHQLRRIMHHHPTVLVTTCEAQFFPASVIQFDKVLADVPCTGDGTSRKNIGVWKHWSVLAALGLHPLQIEIAWKGAAGLLKVGGSIVYSTCSFNPIENEAVVAELLRRSNGSLELLPAVQLLEGFRTRPGMTTWKVFCEEKSRREISNAAKKNNKKMQQRRKEWDDKKKKQADGNDEQDAAKESTAVDKVENDNADDEKSGDAAEPKQDDQADNRPPSAPKNGNRPPRRKFEPTSIDEQDLIDLATSTAADGDASGCLIYCPTYADVPEKLKQQRRVRQSCFPPTKEELEQFHLDRCIRCLPQDNDTGGFFVALLRKTAALSAKDRREQQRKQADDDQQEGQEEEPEPAGGRGRIKGNLVRDKDGKVHPEGYGRDDFIAVPDDILDPIVESYGLSSPTFRKDLYMTRAGGDTKIIYYIGPEVKDLIDIGLQKRVTVINSGLKGFYRNSKEGELNYRICQEGAHFLAPHMCKRKFTISRQDFDVCLAGEICEIAKLSEALRNLVRPIPVGSFLVLLDGYEESFSDKMLLTMWRCRGDKVEALVAKKELEAIRSKLQAIDAAIRNQ